MDYRYRYSRWNFRPIGRGRNFGDDNYPGTVVNDRIRHEKSNDNLLELGRPWSVMGIVEEPNELYFSKLVGDSNL